MPNSVGNLEVGVSTNLASLYTGLQQAADRIEQFGSKVSKQMDAVGAAFGKLQGFVGAIGVSLGAAAFAEGIKSAIDYADHLHDLSKTTGIAVETLGGLGYAAKQSGIDLDTVAKGVQKLAQQMAAAAGGNQELSDLFVRMGVSIKDATGALRPLDQVLADVATKFQSYADGPEKAALATELFKKGGEALIPLLDEGGDKIRELVAEYQKYGGVTTDTAARADQFNDTLAKVGLITGSLVRQTAAELLPALQATANVFLDIKEKGDGVSVVSTLIVGAFKAIAVAAIGVYTAFQAVGKALGGILLAAIEGIQGNYKKAWEALKNGFGDAADAVSNGWDRAATIVSASASTIAVSAQTNLGKTVAPIRQTNKALDDLTLSIQRLLKPFNDLIAELGKTGASLDAQLSSLKQYGVETKATALATAQYELEQGKLADKLQVLSFLYPQLAEAVKFLILAQAKHNDEIESAIDLEKKYLDAVKSHVDAVAASVAAVEKEISAEHDRADAIGRTRAEFLDLKIAQEESALASLRVIDGAELEAKAAELRIAKLRELRDLTAKTDFLENQNRAWTDLFNNIGDRAAAFIADFVHNGSSAFKNLWEDFKNYALAVFAKIAAQQVIISIVGSVAPQLSGVASNAFTGSNTGLLSLLTGSGGGISLGGQLASNGFPNLGAFVNGITHPLATLGTAFTEGAEAAGGFASILGSVTPFLAAIPLLSGLIGSLFSSKPSEVKGQFGISAGTSGFEDNAFTASKFGNLGFIDSNTQQFSGDAAQVLNKVIAGALDAFEARFSPEQSKRLADILQGTTFATQEGTFTTQDFLQKYGGQVLQQVIVAAFDVLDPALADVAKNFHGTADEIAAFGNTLLTVYDATKGLSDTFKANVAQALSGATQEVANKVLAFVGVVKTFGTSIDGLGPKLEALDPAKITAFVDALGGVQNFAQAFAFLSENFTTAADKAAQAQQALTDGFAKLNIAVPETHKAFLDLVNSLIAAGNTDLAASVLQLAPIFIQVSGTADQAAKATAELGDAVSAAADTIVQGAKDIWIVVVSVGSVLKQSVGLANSLLSTFSDLSNDSTGDFGDKLGIQIGLITDALSSVDRADFTSSTAFNAYVGTLKNAATHLSTELARFTVLSAQYDAARAEQLVTLEQWYSTEKGILAKTPDPTSALAALDTIFAQKWKAIVDGVQTGVDGTLDQLARLKQGIADYLKGLVVSDISPLTPIQKLQQAQTAFEAEFAKAQGGDQGALGDVTKFADTYLNLAREFYKSSQPFVDIFTSVTGELGNLAGTTPTGQPLPKTDAMSAIAAAVPVGSTIASSADVQNLLKGIQSALAAHADAGTQDSITQRRTISDSADKIVAAVGSELK